MSRNTLALAASVIVTCIAAVGCNRIDSASQEHASVTTESDGIAVEGKEFHARLLEVAAKYQEFGRFDERLRFGPPLCIAPSAPPKKEPNRLRLSKSDDANSHGKKLYYLYVKDGESYAYTDIGKRQQDGQVIVKEAWKPEQTKDKRGATVAFDPDDQEHYRAGEKLGLFIMAKLDPQTPNTDEGWIYGTVSADGKQVSSAGRVENCMACHNSDETIDRMFGVRVSEPGDNQR
jgi:hypothetical protein